MKRIGLLVAIVAFALCLVSCGKSGPTADAEKMVKVAKELKVTVNKASEDGKVSDEEAEKINSALKEFYDLLMEFEKKYENDEEAEKEFEEYLESEENEKLGEEIEEAMGKLSQCEGFDKIDLGAFM
ncbi:MAG TPA: hypothetical protein PLW77_07855 [Bacteroidales bacterium]|nr:hypothetical protein [Bacteroidales bacterium]HQB21710.1 hypothetical protein [Bacteroidales bacterium]